MTETSKSSCKHTSIIVLIHCVEPANIVVSVWYYVDIDSSVDIQYASWTDIAQSSLLRGDSCGGQETAAEAQKC